MPTNRDALNYANAATQAAADSIKRLKGPGGAVNIATGQAGPGLLLLAEALNNLSIAVALLAKG